MADEIDKAQPMEELMLEGMINRKRGVLRCQGSAVCADCGHAIPDARRAAVPSATRCVDCQDCFEGGY